MANAGLAPYPKFKSILADGSGLPNAGGFVYFYVAGTATPKDTQVSRTGANNANPVELDSNGEADVWYLSGSYKVVEATSALVTIRTTDDVSAAGDLPFIWTKSGSDIYYNGGNVYIGATSGGEKLTVVGTASISSTLALGNTLTLNTDKCVINGTTGQIYIKPSSAGTISPNAGADDFVIESSGNSGMSIYSPDASTSSLHFGCDSSDVAAKITFNYDGNSLVFGSAKAGTTVDIRSGANTSAISLASNQAATFASTINCGAVTSTGAISGTSLSTGDETFTYDEGTFTATFQGYTTSVTRVMSYVRIGSAVELYINGVTGTSNSTALTFSGIPESLRPPTFTRECPLVKTTDAGTTYRGGIISIQLDGTAIISVNDGGTSYTSTFTNSATSKGFSTACISYNIKSIA